LPWLCSVWRRGYASVDQRDAVLEHGFSRAACRSCRYATEAALGRHARGLLILDRITASILEQPNRRAENFRILRQGLGYCWSVAAVSDPEDGKALMEKWLLDTDPDIQWIMRENLKKNRLVRMDADWVHSRQAHKGEKS
jgi:hypothetical protein